MAAKLRKEREGSPRLTAVAKGIKNSVDNSSDSTEMDKANSRRLSAMERIQAETNKRLEDVMQSKLNLQSMLQYVLCTLSNSNVSGNQRFPHTGVNEIVGKS
ncbi:hypothetical protein M758_UG151700 [Ceratodon purpureus]|nr:hypothetical protein M758_UG151700 [Ceratodon purpureus]